MARNMVTRTIVTTTAEVLCVNTSTAETFVQEFTLPKTYKMDKDVLKACEKIEKPTDIKLVHVINKTETEQLYGMTEQEFIQYASPMESRTQKVNAL